MNKVLLFICILTTGSLRLSAQSFWKISGNETHENALHAGILYLPGDEAIFVSTYNMGIFRSTNKGTTWDHVLVLPKDQPVTALYTSGSGVILGGGKGRIYRSETGGDKWEEILLDFTLIGNFTEDKNGHLYACSADSGGILKSEDNGISWTEHNTGLPDKYVNNLISDKNGNMFCSLLTDRSGSNGGLFSWDEHQNKWVKKDIKLKIDDTNYVIKVSAINDMRITSAGEIIISLDGVAANFGVFGLFNNSVSGANATALWTQENWNDTTRSPFNMIMDGIFLTSTGNIFASRISDGSAGIYAKMAYSGKWSRYNEGIPRVSMVRGYFCETPDGMVYLTTEFSNKIVVTNESVPGKKYFHISKGQLLPMKLYEFQTLHATSGLEVKFKSMDNKTSIEGNEFRAIGLGFSVIKAFTEGNDSMYYSEEDMTLSIAKAENNITLEPLREITEGDSIYLSAHSNSGEEVFFKVIDGNARFIKNKLEYNGPGKILFMMTEPGNGSYEPADTILMELCINPRKPVISADTLSGTVKLNSSSTNNNHWYVNHIFTGHTTKAIIPVTEGIYTLQVVTDGCFSEFSGPYHYLSTNDETISSQYFTVFPIPFRDNLSIKKKIYDDIKMQYCIIDLTGKVLISSEQEGDFIILEMTSLLPGWYILKVTLNQTSEFFKISKSR